MIGRRRAPDDTPERQIGELRREIERLREFCEQRLRAQETMARAMLAQSAAGAAEALEPRIRLATREAMAFAEQGLEQHEAALRALGRRLAEREAGWTPPPRADLAAPAGGCYAIGAAGATPDGARHLALRDDSEAAFLADLENLAILPGGAHRLSACHVVEFAPLNVLRARVLPHWRSRLAAGGELEIVTLDGPAWAAGLARLGGDFERFRTELGADGRGRTPRSLFDGPGLGRLLAEQGFLPGSPEASAPHALRIVARAAAR